MVIQLSIRRFFIIFAYTFNNFFLIISFIYLAQIHDFNKFFLYLTIQVNYQVLYEISRCLNTHERYYKKS